jgi:C6 transcription factor Pro1
MDGAGLEAEHVKKIKRAAEDNYKARRRGLIPNFAEIYTETAGRNPANEAIKEWKDPDAGQLMIREGASLAEHPNRSSILSSLSDRLNSRQSSTEEGIHDLAATSHGNPVKASYSGSQEVTLWRPTSPHTMNSIWWHGGLGNTYNVRNRKELGLLMHYLDNVFSLQFGFYRPSSSNIGVTWYTNTLLRSKPLYHSTLTISAVHQALLKGGSLRGPLKFSEDADQIYALTLKELQRQIDSLPNFTGGELLKARFEVLGIMNQVLAVEVSQCVLIVNFNSKNHHNPADKMRKVFRNIGGHWDIHLQAARTFLSMIGTSATDSKTLRDMPEPPKRLDILDQILKDDKNQFLSRSDMLALNHFVTCFIWVDILSYATGLRTFNSATFDYLNLLEDGTLELNKIMGCQNWVMIIMAKTALLEEWKKQKYPTDNPNSPDLFSQATILEALLRRGIARLINARAELSGLDLDSNIVTELFACAAITYLHVVVSGAYPELPEIRESVTRTLMALAALPQRLLIRISWPFAITGCMALGEEQDLFRSLVLEATQTGANIGTIWKGLMVMEECWRINRNQVGGEVSWTTAMKSLGYKILLC